MIYRRAFKNILGVFILAAVLVPAVTTQAATSTYVNNTDCAGDKTGSKEHPVCTVQEGVNLAPEGSRLYIASGTYPETVTINKKLEIRGPKYAVDARTRSADAGEAVIGAIGGGFIVTAGEVKIDGLKFKNATTTSGVNLSPNAGGYSVTNNIFENNRWGLNLASNGDKKTTVRQNNFINNNSVLTSSHGIISSLGLKKAYIDSNRFTGHKTSAITLSGGIGTSLIKQSDIKIINNRMVSDSSITIVNSQDLTISGNNSTGSNVHGLLLAGANSDFKVVSNTFNGSQIGLRLTRAGGVSLPNTDMKIVRNTLSGNSLDGMLVEANTTDVDFIDNTINDNLRDGLRVIGSAIANLAVDNELLNNAGQDINDFSVGTKTRGTANQWLRNVCVNSIPSGLCTPPPPPPAPVPAA